MLSIFFGDLRRILKDPFLGIWLFLMPVVFTYFTAQLNRAPRMPRAALKIVNNDAGPLGERLANAIPSKRISLVFSSEDAEKEKEIDAILTIPEDFSARLNAGKQAEVFLRIVDSGGPGLLAESAVWQGWFRFLQSRLPGSDEVSGDAGAVGLALRKEPLKGGKIIPAGNQQAIPGNLVTFVLVILLTGGAATLATERAHGLLRRLASAPVPRQHILFAKMLSRFVLAAIQVAIFVALGSTVFKVDWGGRPFALAVTIAGFALSAVGIGMLLGATFRTPEAAAAFGVLISLSLASLGGAWWPLEIVSPPLQTVASLLPTGWTMNALHSLMVFHEPITAIVRPVLALYLLGFGTLYLAAHRLTFQ